MKKISRIEALRNIGLIYFGLSTNLYSENKTKNKDDWLGICINKGNVSLFKELKIPYKILNFKGNEQYIAKQIGGFVKSSGKKPFIVDFAHYIMAYAMNPKDSVICFDNHADDGIDYEPIQKFTSGTFHLFFPAKKTFVLGATAKQYGNAVKIFKPENIDDFFNEDIGDNIFFSYDLDVLDPKYYRSIYSQSNLSPGYISELTEKIIKDKNITGLNIAGYDKVTNNIVKKILRPIFGF